MTLREATIAEEDLATTVKDTMTMVKIALQMIGDPDQHLPLEMTIAIAIVVIATSPLEIVDTTVSTIFIG